MIDHDALAHIQIPVRLPEHGTPPLSKEDIVIGTFVILKNGLFGAISGFCEIPPDADETDRALIYDYDFEMRAFNDAPDDESPVKFEDIVWAAPRWVKVHIEIED